MISEAAAGNRLLTDDGRARVGWWLALEPLGTDAIAWSLIRVDDDVPDGPVGAGLRTGIAAQQALAAQLIPGAAASSRRDHPLWTGPLVDLDAERWTAVRLGQELLPVALREELLAADQSRVRHTVTVACRGWLAQVPWELLALDSTGDVRLVERAQVGAGLSPTIIAGRSRAPDPRPGAPALRVIDPGPRTQGRLEPLYPGGYPDVWDDEGVLASDEKLIPDGEPMGAGAFGNVLRAERGWSRLLYVGHALPGTADTPAGAALVFSSPEGLDRLSAHAWLAAPETWPAPARLALIACGSDDSLHVEQSGLPVAAVNAGAQLLTVTRWVLPTDLDPPREAATTALALAVDTAHQEEDALAAIGRWQTERLDVWRRHGRRVDSPLMWGSLATYVVSPAITEPAS